MYAVHKGQVLGIHVLGHRFIGRQHAFFNNGLCQAAFALDECHRMTIFIELYLYLRQVKVDGAAAVALSFQSPTQFRQGFQHGQNIAIVRQERLCLIHQYLVDNIVGQAAVDVNHRRQNLITRNLAVRANLHFAGHGQAVNAGIQAANTVGKFLGQHGNNPVHQIHTGTTGIGLPVEGRVFFHIMTDIGDINAQKIRTVRIFPRIDTVVQVLGVLAVHRDNLQVTAVSPALIFSRRWFLLHRVSLSLYIFGESF